MPSAEDEPNEKVGVVAGLLLKEGNVSAMAETAGVRTRSWIVEETCRSSPEVVTKWPTTKNERHWQWHTGSGNRKASRESETSNKRQTPSSEAPDLHAALEADPPN